ncbi:MAG: RsmB/NOP family class I SAM-dependent RNA methyltransferase [Magnetococcales bacterium]|nr:RsmB/NOP family class I SAM-dependent RNA methyltransferase [Magnetococcales bacterium]
MNPDPTTLRLTVALLEEVLDHAIPADVALRRLVQQRRSGPAERTRIGDLLFTVLRHRHLLASRSLTPNPSLSELVALASHPEALTPASDLPGRIQASLPEWLWNAWVAQWGADATHRLGQALNQPAPTDLRVNRQRLDRTQLQALLASRAIQAEPIPATPDGLRLTGHPPVTTLDWHRQGLFEIQDAGSQWIAPLLNVPPGATVFDLCAGGGGKTAHLISLLGRASQIIATDTDARRLHQLTQRVRRLQPHRVKILPALRHEGDPLLKPWTGKCDAVLVDAPCSGTGTLRRHPEIKWHLTPEKISAFHERQCALLAAAARLLRPGGRMVYATCSLLHQENQAVAESFLNENPDFQRLDPMPSLAAQGFSGVYCHDSFLTLLPHVAQCDGFFAALFQRNR